MRLAAAIMLAGAVAGCASAPRGPSRDVIDRALVRAPGAAQPSTLVATELAYAREAREDGQYTAALRYAAPGAVVHGRNGTVLAEPFFSSQRNPKTSVAWNPRVIVMSCDGSLAASQGRFRDQEGLVGDYVTVWRRLREDSGDAEYRWIYDVAGRDNPQPAAPQNNTVASDDDIVVTAIDAVQGLIAECPRGVPVPAPPPVAVGEDQKNGGTISRDGSLRWRWEHRANGIKSIEVDYFYGGRWQTAIQEGLTSPPEG
ncbi:MAG: hypothetical protein AAGK02_10135 [Pseudomonadota bacterium]